MTKPVTTRGSYGEYFGARHKMGYWLLFYRVYVSSYDLAINQKLEFTINVLPDSAEPDLSFWYVTVSGTSSTENSLFWQLLV